MEQNALTVILPIQQGQATALTGVLDQIRADMSGNPYVRWDQSPSTHFARWVILDDAGAGTSRLYFSSCFDGAREAYLQEMARIFGPGMDAIWSRCVGYPGLNPANSAAYAEMFTRYILQHDIPIQTYYVAFRGRTVLEIQQSLQHQEQSQQALDALPHRAHPPAAGRPGTASPRSGAGIGAWLMQRIVGALQWLVGIREGVTTPVRPYTTSPGLFAMEDIVVQNQMTVIVPIKKRRLSRILIRMVLFAINTAARLAKKPVVGLSQIHFARWVIIDNGANLLFESNYDGSWESYIDDFVDHASFGLNMIWGNCERYPVGGAKDIEAFKQSIRANQFPAQVFYSAYPDATIPNILNALAIQDVPTQQISTNVRSRQFASGYYASPR